MKKVYLEYTSDHWGERNVQQCKNNGKITKEKHSGLDSITTKSPICSSASFGEEIHDRLVSSPYALEEKVGHKNWQQKRNLKINSTNLKKTLKDLRTGPMP